MNEYMGKTGDEVRKGNNVDRCCRIWLDLENLIHKFLVAIQMLIEQFIIYHLQASIRLCVTLPLSMEVTNY